MTSIRQLKCRISYQHRPSYQQKRHLGKEYIKWGRVMKRTTTSVFLCLNNWRTYFPKRWYLLLGPATVRGTYLPSQNSTFSCDRTRLFFLHTFLPYGCFMYRDSVYQLTIGYMRINLAKKPRICAKRERVRHFGRWVPPGTYLLRCTVNVVYSVNTD